MGLMLFGRATLDRLPFGIVLPDKVAVKEGADPNYRTSFDVHAGLKVRLFDQEHDWVRGPPGQRPGGLGARSGGRAPVKRRRRRSQSLSGVTHL
jgi:hypothetical protein